ncbi:UNVERIFIED_ORG: putative phage terminase large subunit-like protein [Rhodococcus erythropolis]
MNPLEYISQFPRELIASSEGRRLLTRDDPLLFSVVYLSHSIRFEGQEPSFSQFHLDLAEYAKSWMQTDSQRDCWIAPREAGKSQWLFKILPLWAASHGHLKFIAAFSDAGSQATDHLDSFKFELDHNKLLRKDYPELCKPMMRGAVKRYVSQSNEQIQQANGFSFSAKGIDAKSLGMKIGDQRPDLILLDDIEPTESNYSVNEAEKRKRTMLDGIFYLGSRAKIVIVGTTTMPGSIIDQCRKVAAQKSLQTNQDSSFETSSQSESSRADNIDYVSLTKDNLTSSNLVSGTSDHLETIEDAFSQSVTGKGIKSLRSETTSCISVCQDDESVGSIGSLSSSENQSIDRQDGFISKSVNELVDNDSEVRLTSAEKSDLKSERDFLGTSTSTFSISQPDNRTQPSFFEKQQLELEKFNIKSEPNRGEADIEQTELDDSIDAELQWVLDERINVHYYPAIVVDSDGNEQSWWPEFKSMQVLNRDRHTRAFAMNMMNRPVNVDAQYWNEQDIVITEAESYVRTLISVDPAVSTKTSNDYTALVVVSLASDGKVYVRHAEQLRLVSTELKERVNDLIELFDVGLVYVETNQGGNLWKSVFDGVKANFRSVHQTEPKALRAARALDYYRKDKVRHTRHFDQLEEQMYSFPKVAHDDLIDAMGTGVHYFLSASSQPKAVRKTYI